MAADRSDILLLSSCATLLVAAAAVSLRPLHVETRAETNTGGAPSTEALPSTSPGETFDRSVFTIDLWVEPPSPPPKPEPVVQQAAAPEPPPDLDLIAITRAGDTHEAILYDKRADRLRTVSAGDALGPLEIVSVGPVEVRFAIRGRESIMRLDQPRIAPRAGGSSDG